MSNAYLTSIQIASSSIFFIQIACCLPHRRSSEVFVSKSEEVTAFCITLFLVSTPAWLIQLSRENENELCFLGRLSGKLYITRTVPFRKRSISNCIWLSSLGEILSIPFYTKHIILYITLFTKCKPNCHISSRAPFSRLCAKNAGLGPWNTFWWPRHKRLVFWLGLSCRGSRKKQRRFSVLLCQRVTQYNKLFVSIRMRAKFPQLNDQVSPVLPPFSLIRDFGKQNTRGNVSKIFVSLACYRQAGSKSTNHSH